MPRPLGPWRDKRTWDRFALADGNEKHPRPRLRNKMRGVDDRGSKFVLGVRERGGDRGEVLSAVGGQTSIDVFQNDRSWSAVRVHKTAHQFPKRPERARTGRGIVPFAAKAPIAARKGK